MPPLTRAPRGPTPKRSPGIPAETPIPDPEKLNLTGPKRTLLAKVSPIVKLPQMAGRRLLLPALRFAVAAHAKVAGPLLCAGVASAVTDRRSIQCTVDVILLLLAVLSHPKVARPVFGAFASDDSEGRGIDFGGRAKRKLLGAFALLANAVLLHPVIRGPVFPAFAFSYSSPVRGQGRADV